MVKTNLIKQLDDVFVWLNPIALIRQENTLGIKLYLQKNGNIKNEFQNSLTEIIKRITPEQKIYFNF